MWSLNVDWEGDERSDRGGYEWNDKRTKEEKEQVDWGSRKVDLKGLNGTVYEFQWLRMGPGLTLLKCNIHGFMDVLSQVTLHHLSLLMCRLCLPFHLEEQRNGWDEKDEWIATQTTATECATKVALKVRIASISPQYSVSVKTSDHTSQRWSESESLPERGGHW